MKNKGMPPEYDFWWQIVEMPDGTKTPGRHDYTLEPERFLFPEDLTGKSVADFGTWNGFWAVEAKKRGASYVLALDRFWPPIKNSALEAYGIEYRCSGDLDFPTELSDLYGKFDVVLFYGILYHLKNPYMGLLTATLCTKIGGELLLESSVNQGKLDRVPTDIPAFWIEDDGEGTNYFQPNALAVEELGKMLGLKRVGFHMGFQRMGMAFEREYYEDREGKPIDYILKEV